MQHANKNKTTCHRLTKYILRGAGEHSNINKQIAKRYQLSLHNSSFVEIISPRIGFIRGVLFSQSLGKYCSFMRGIVWDAVAGLCCVQIAVRGTVRRLRSTAATCWPATTARRRPSTARCSTPRRPHACRAETSGRNTPPTPPDFCSRKTCPKKRGASKYHQRPITHRAVRKGGGARGLAPNGCMVSTTNNIIVSKEAILSPDNSGKPLGDRGSATNPTGEPTALSQTPSWWEGVAAPSPRTQELHPRSRSSVSPPSQMKSPRHALGYPWLRFVLCVFICAFWFVCMSPFFYVSLGSWVISLTVFGVSITNLNEPPRALAASTIAWVRS